MTLSVSLVTKYGKNYDGSSIPYLEEVSKKTYEHCGSKNTLIQYKNDRGTVTELYRNGELVRKKLNVPHGIYRDHYVGGDKIAHSYISKNKTGLAEYYFYRKPRIYSKEFENVMSGGLFEGKIFGNPSSFKIAEFAGEHGFWELGGGSRNIFKKIVSFLSKVR